PPRAGAELRKDHRPLALGNAAAIAARRHEHAVAVELQRPGLSRGDNVDPPILVGHVYEGRGDGVQVGIRAADEEDEAQDLAVDAIARAARRADQLLEDRV